MRLNAPENETEREIIELQQANLELRHANKELLGLAEYINRAGLKYAEERRRVKFLAHEAMAKYGEYWEEK